MSGARGNRRDGPDQRRQRAACRTTKDGRRRRQHRIRRLLQAPPSCIFSPVPLVHAQLYGSINPVLGCLPLLHAGVSASMAFRDGGSIMDAWPATRAGPRAATTTTTTTTRVARGPQVVGEARDGMLAAGRGRGARGCMGRCDGKYGRGHRLGCETLDDSARRRRLTIIRPCVRRAPCMPPHPRYDGEGTWRTIHPGLPRGHGAFSTQGEGCHTRAYAIYMGRKYNLDFRL